MKELVIFDMDGLLLDTERIHDWSWEKSLKEFNLNVDVQKRQALIGLGRSDYDNYVREMIPNDDIRDQVRSFQRNLYNDYFSLNKPDVKPGVFELINELNDKSVKLAIASSTKQERAIQFTQSVDLYSKFDYHVFGDMVSFTKPDPAIYNNVVEFFNIDRSKCLILEDSFHGIQAANNAGIDVIWIKDISKPPKHHTSKILNEFTSLTDAKEYILSLIK